jgi:hypothetical protein
MLDRSACDLKVSNKRAVEKCIGICCNAFRMDSSNLAAPRSACASTRIPGTDLLS